MNGVHRLKSQKRHSAGSGASLAHRPITLSAAANTKYKRSGNVGIFKVLAEAYRIDASLIAFNISCADIHVLFSPTDPWVK